jgi:Family of unknown function (DUF5681)
MAAPVIGAVRWKARAALLEEGNNRGITEVRKIPEGKRFQPGQSGNPGGRPKVMARSGIPPTPSTRVGRRHADGESSTASQARPCPVCRQASIL